MTTRRGALGVLSAGGLAFFGSASPAAAFFFGRSRTQQVQQAVEAMDFSDLPADWVRLQGQHLHDYAGYLSGLRLKTLTPMQVIEAHAKRRGSVWNSLPPKSMWRNMAPTLKAVDRVAVELNQPVREVVSAYRSPAYNARCPGAKRGSWHQANVAVDVRFASRPSTVSAMARHLRDRGVFKGGVGRYYGFTHIDTRGTNADW